MVATPIEIRFSDIDQLGHVNNAVYLSYLEHARTKLFDEYFPFIDWSKQALILAKVEINYLRPVFLQDKLTVYTWCSKIGGKSFNFSQSLKIAKDTKEVEVATAETVLVSYDYPKNEAITMPDQWKEVLESMRLPN